MAIRKDLDDMLNTLKSGNALESPKKPEPKPIPKLSDKKIDSMSVDDLLSSINGDKKAPAEPVRPAAPAPSAKKRIVISHELPDYEAIRAEELKRQQAEKERIEADRLAAEKAERERIRAEREAEMARIAAERKAAEEAEFARREAERKAAEEAEFARREAERKAAEEAELARREAERKAAEEAELARREAERKAAEEAELARREAERKAAEEAELARREAERKAAEEAEFSRKKSEEKPSAKDIFAPSGADERASSENKDPFKATAAPDAVGSAEKSQREKTIEELDREYLEEMLGMNKVPFWKRRKAKKAEKAEAEAKAEAEEKIEDAPKTEEKTPITDEPFSDAPPAKKKGKLATALQNILDEDPDEIIKKREEEIASGGSGKGGLKKGFYAVSGVIFGILACIGLITVIAKGIDKFGSYTSGDTKKDEFENAIYPAVIMDIESFASPDELPSDQIITAAIWSMILKDDVTQQYEQTFDVVIIPAADVESAAVKLFGDDLPKLEHTNVGPAESKFYYNEETKSYNVPVAPITYTYSPEVREATKVGNEYTVTVDYIDELPSWLPKTSSKSVEYVLLETNGSYQLKSMKIISTNTNAV